MEYSVRRLILVMLLWIFCSGFKAKVTKVYDGDTLTVKSANGEQRIRLFGVDCPELKQEYGIQARNFTRASCLKKTVEIDEKDKPSYGRLVADVRLENGHVLNKLLVVNGQAWHEPRYAKGDKQLEQMQEYAKENRIGLWEAEDPEEPREWRRRKKEEAKNKALEKAGYEYAKQEFQNQRFYSIKRHWGWR